MGENARAPAALARRPVGSTGLAVTTLGLGTTALGGMFAPLPMADGLGLVDAAWDLGIRLYDTAPMYGLGRAEMIVGHALRTRIERDGSAERPVIGSKVGRLMVRERPGRPIRDRLPKNPLDPGWGNALPFEEVFDYSYDGVMRSFDDSHARLGLESIDVLQVHDIGRVTHGERHDHHWDALTRGGGFRALGELRGAGLVKAVGVGANEWEVIRDALDAFDLDCCLMAGRYTLLDQTALDALLPACERRGVSVFIGGPFNSGILAAPAGAPRKFNYRDADPDTIARADRISALLEGFAVPLPAAALQFPLAHPAVATVLVGCRTAAELRQVAGWMAHPIPPEAWRALEAQGLLAPGTPTPARPSTDER